MSSRVCKFYLQGTCRFGNNCKFSHPATTGNNTPNSTFNRFSDPNRFNYLNPDEKLKQKMKQKVGSVESVAEIIQNDFKHWLPSKVWPFSCYSVNSIDNLFPELNDLSTDEAHHAFISARHSNSIDRHIHEITTEGKKIQEFIDRVAKASKDDILALVRQRIGSESESSGVAVTSSNSGNIFSQPTNNNTSGVANPFANNSASTFGGQSVFSNSASTQKPGSVFGSSSSNVFGSNTPTASPSPFVSNSSSGFGISSNSQSALSSNSNIFKSSMSSQPTNNQSNPFLSAASNSVSSTGFGQPSFGQSNSEKSTVFGTSNSTPSVFGQPNSGQSGFGQPGFGQTAFGQPNSGQSVFGQSNTAQPAFGTTNSGQSAFGQTNSGQSVFGQTNTTQSAFGQTNLGQPAFGQQNVNTTQSSLGAQSNIGISGNSVTQPAAVPTQSTPAINQNSTTAFTGIATSAAPQNPFTNTPVQPQHTIKEDLSRIPKLTEEDLIQYRNKAFEWGKIPECPPPPELCV